MTTRFVSRSGEKLHAALEHFSIHVEGLSCADLGSHTGGFTDCLLQHGAARVYAIDTCYGTLAWKLRKDPRVVVLERTNALHARLPEAVHLVTIDVGWTPQRLILPAARTLMPPTSQPPHRGLVITLIKPHYESDPDELVGGTLPDEQAEARAQTICTEISRTGWKLCGLIESPLRGHGGNREYLAILEPAI